MVIVALVLAVLPYPDLFPSLYAGRSARALVTTNSVRIALVVYGVGLLTIAGVSLRFRSLLEKYFFLVHFSLFSTVSLFLGIYDRPAADYFYTEDRPGEYLGALLYLGTSVGWWILLQRQRRSSRGRSRKRVYAFFCLLFFFGFGEEISWGQRILGVPTPEWIAEVNRQDEINVHNLEFPIKSDNVVRIFHGIYGVLLPLAASRFDGIHRLVARFQVPLFPYQLSFCMVLSLLLHNELTHSYYRNTDEIQELGYALIYAVFVLGLLRSDRQVGYDDKEITEIAR